MAFNISMKRGRTLVFTLALTKAGVAYNLTGLSPTLRMTAKYDPHDADGSAVFSRTSAVGGQIDITSVSGGLATVTIVPANTSPLPASQVNLYYDIQLTDSTGVWTVQDGILTVLPNISLTTP